MRGWNSSLHDARQGQDQREGTNSGWLNDRRVVGRIVLLTLQYDHSFDHANRGRVGPQRRARTGVVFRDAHQQ